MDMVTLGLGLGTLATVPLGAAVKKSYSNERRLTVLETNYGNIDSRLTALNEKLDRLIERFLPNG